MRQAGTLSSKQDAERFANYLLTLGITAKVEAGADGEASVWIHDENQLDESKRELETFARTRPTSATKPPKPRPARFAARRPRKNASSSATTSTCATNGPTPGGGGP